MEVIKREVEVYICSDGYETIEKWRAEAHQKSIYEDKQREELLKNIDKVEWVNNTRFIRFNKDLDYKTAKATMAMWCKKEHWARNAECDICEVKKDKWYKMEVGYKEDDGDYSLVIEFIHENVVAMECRTYLDFLGQEEQLKLF